MILLCEREIGFDTSEIGFPAVDGCRGIVLVTSGGLFGYHLNGSLSQAKRDAFANFITSHAQGSPKRNLYAASKQGGNGPIQKIFHDEIRDLAQKLVYNGSIYWADLSAVPGVSTYVHFLGVDHHTCGVTARTWNDPLDSIPANKAPYAAGVNRAMANGGANTEMYINVDPAGLRGVYPVKI